MRKLWICSIVFLIVAIIAFFPLTVEVFGDITYEKIRFWAIIFGIGLIGSCICSFARAILKMQSR